MKKALLGVGVVAAATGKALYEIGEDFDTAYDKIRSRTGATGREMGKLKSSFRDVVGTMPVDFEDAADAVGGLNQRLGLTGKPLTRLSRQIVALGELTGASMDESVRSVTRLFGDWGVATDKQTHRLDQLYRASQETGIVVGELADLMVRWGAPMRALGFSFDEATAMFGRFEKEGVNVQTMLPGLRYLLKNLAAPAGEAAIAFRELDINLRDPQTALVDLIDTIQRMPDETKAAGYAAQIFGARAGTDMARAIIEGRFELDKLMEAIRKGGNTLLGDERRFRDFNEEVQILGNQLKLLLEPAATAAFKAIGDGAKWLRKNIGPAIQSLRDFWQEAGVLRDVIGRVTQFIGDVFGSLIQTIRGVVKVISGILTGNFGRAWEGVKEIFSAGVRFMLAPLKAVAGLIADIAKRIGSALKGPLVAIWNAIKTAWRKGVDFILGMVTTILDGIAKMADIMSKIPGPIGDVWDKVQAGAEDAADSINHLRERIRGMPKAVQAIREDWNAGWKALADNADKNGKNAFKYWEHWLGKIDRTGREKTGDFRDGVVRNYWRMAQGSVGGIAFLAGETNKTLDSLNVKADIYVAKGMGGALAAAGNFIGQGVKKQKGGLIVGGIGSGDKVPAMLEPGEVVINREAVKAMGGARRANRVNQMIPRFAKGGVAGGLDFALGPYDIPPIQYAADHAGGNSHVHITGTTTPWVVAIGRTLQRMGFMVGEHPAFGGVQASHSATGGHYDALAIDVNSAADETRGEVAQIARLLGGKGGAAVVDKIARVLLKGPKGPLRDIGQKALDKVRAAANQYLAKQAPSGVAPMGGSGVFSKPELVSLWNRTGRSGDANLMAAIALAESGGNPSIVNPSSQATGLWQIIPSTWAAFGRGSFARAKDPTANALAAHGILSGQGLGAWEAYTNNAYSQYLQRGGIVGLQKGTKGLGPGSGINILPPKGWEPLKEKLAFWRKESGRLETVASEFETFYQSLASPGGEDVTEQEKRDLVGLFGSLVGALQKRRRLVQQGLKLPWMKGDKKEKSLEQELVNLQGVTGLGGLIQAAKASRDTWAGTAVGPDFEALYELQKQLTSQALSEAAMIRAQSPVYAALANAPVMHSGGVVPGVTGQSVPVIAQAGETVTPAGSPQVTVVIEDGAVDPNKIRVVVDDHISTQVRRAQRGPAIGRNATYRR